MAIAAVPKYIGQDFKDAPPGHRFMLYFQAWQENWSRVQNITPDELKKVISLSDNAKKLLSELSKRQSTIAEGLGLYLLKCPAKSIAPFTTGTGIEHPLENGFAFLNPYGLPYLPGSSVKGVIRRAAELLCDGTFGETHGWDQKAIDALFGYESKSGETDESLNRGALIFWDVFPQLAGDSMSIDIMTPHHSEYYQSAKTPHDSESPNPILFLTIPPKSEFNFYVQCQSALLPLPLHNQWKSLLESAFHHAFEWLGFGAKTAVGYGQMQSPFAVHGASAESPELHHLGVSPQITTT